MRGHSHTIVVVVAAAATGYGWWATGVRPFTPAAYLAVALPVAAVAGAGWWWGRHRAPGRSPVRGLRGAAPWLGLALAGLGLEIAGLALGGRSPRVPTLSTVVDHALAFHATRLVVFAAWVALGLALLRLRGRRRPRSAP